MALRSLRTAIFFIMFLHVASSLQAQTRGGLVSPFFIKVMGQYYFHTYSPEFVAADFLKSWPGFRAALGYEWQRFDFSLESGLSYFEGQDPYQIYVESLTMVPLLFKFGYTFPLPWGLGIQPEVGIGPVFNKSIHDSTVHSGPRDMQESFTTNIFTSVHLNLVWEIPKAPFIRLHAGGGVDMIPETDALILIPAVQAGITFIPRFPRLLREEKPKPPALTDTKPPALTETVPSALTETDESILSRFKDKIKRDNDIDIEAVVQGIMMTIWNIQYIPDSDQFLPSEYPRLDLIAEVLKLVPENRIFLVEGHVADVPSPSPVSNRELSMQRAQRMGEALVQRGIRGDRFIYRAWGGTKPRGDNAIEEGRRLNRRIEITVLKEGIYQ